MAMETRPLPIGWTLHEAVLDGIEVDVVYVFLEILSITDVVFPEAPLPDSSLSFAFAGMAVLAVFTAAGEVFPGETTLHHPPSARKIAVTLRERPHAMQVIGQYADRLHFERISIMGFNPGLTETMPRKIGSEEPTPVEGDDGEEERSARDSCAPVLGHYESLHWNRCGFTVGQDPPYIGNSSWNWECRVQSPTQSGFSTL